MEDVEVDLVEASLAIARVHVDTADERAFVHERHRDDPHEPLALDERRVSGRGLLEVDLDMGVESPVDRSGTLHRDALRVGVLVAQPVMRDDPERFTVVVDEHHRGGVRGLEQRRRSHDLGKQTIELEDAEHRRGDAVQDADALGHVCLVSGPAAQRSHRQSTSHVAGHSDGGRAQEVTRASGGTTSTTPAPTAASISRESSSAARARNVVATRRIPLPARGSSR